jgi:predicted DNA-binding ribbon-helix-helix protein
MFATLRNSFSTATMCDGFYLPCASRTTTGGTIMQSSVVKRSIIVGGHKTSVSLEDDFWAVVKEIASESGATLSDLVGKIDAEREHGNLSSAIRLFVLRSYRRKLEQQNAIDRTRDLLDTAAAIRVT